MTDSMPNRRLTIVLFEGFEVLDVFGPVELFSKVPGISIDCTSPAAAPVRSAQGVRVVADLTHHDLDDPDILLIPGGAGTRQLVSEHQFLTWLREIGVRARLVISVCTGSAVLAAAGLLDGYRATSNKLAFEWVTGFGASVDWQAQARWVEDRDRWTSSGVAAGMDMTAALIKHLFGPEIHDMAVMRAEYEPHADSTIDPFSQLHGPT